tara:strand:- start:5989 stop:6408 length:420 start_codon:yes stop_codon:yes gene_type:complete
MGKHEIECRETINSFTTIIGTHFVDLKNVTEIEIESGIHKVNQIVVLGCSIKWAMKQVVETWGIKSVGVRPFILKVDTVVQYTLENKSKKIDVDFEFTPESSDITIDTNQFNPLVNGIVPTGVEITIHDEKPTQIIIKF